MKIKTVFPIGYLFCLFAVLFCCSSCFAADRNPSVAAPAGGQKPTRTIIFIIDGLHWQAPERMGLKNIQTLSAKGTLIERTYLLMPYHPTTGEWKKLHDCSMPNPIMLAGTLFITPAHKLIQESFPTESKTAHVTNCTAYASLNRGFSLSMVRNTTDAEAIDFAVRLLETEDIRFMLIHLQDPGTAGFQCGATKEAVPWKHNIWGKGSPYIAKTRQADRLLGFFVEKLKEIGKWNDTLLVVTGDHGQANTGWHPLLPEDSWITPTVFVGPNIARGRTIAYAEHTDIIPTICDFMGVAPPNKNPALGKILTEITRDAPQQKVKRPQLTREINNGLKEYMLLQAQMLLLAEEKDPWLENVLLLASRRFYSLDRFTEWHKAGSLENILKTNRRVIAEMKQALKESPASKAPVVLSLDSQ